MGTALVNWKSLETRWTATLDAERDVHAERGAILLAAKKLVKHGEWEKECKAHFGIDNKQASRYISIAKVASLQPLPGNILERAKAASQILGTAQPRLDGKGHQGPWSTGEASTKKSMLSHEEAFNIIGISGSSIAATAETLDVIFKGLAQRWHPDKGGSAAKFAQLMKAKETLL